MRESLVPCQTDCQSDPHSTSLSPTCHIPLSSLTPTRARALELEHARMRSSACVRGARFGGCCHCLSPSPPLPSSRLLSLLPLFPDFILQCSARQGRREGGLRPLPACRPPVVAVASSSLRPSFFPPIASPIPESLPSTSILGIPGPRPRAAEGKKGRRGRARERTTNVTKERGTGNGRNARHAPPPEGGRPRQRARARQRE